jgi:hypothetical protein
MHNNTDGGECLLWHAVIVDGCKLAAVKLSLVKNTFYRLNAARRGHTDCEKPAHECAGFSFFVAPRANVKDATPLVPWLVRWALFPAHL